MGTKWGCLLEWLLFRRECSAGGEGLWSLFVVMGCDLCAVAICIANSTGAGKFCTVLF